MPITRALLSVSDKTGIADFAKGLAGLGIEILSTGGTAKALREAGVKVKDVSEVTGFPEILEGRVKTLHPLIHGGILALRESKEHDKQLKKHGIQPIDLVCVNLYPFESTVSKKGVALAEALENIDIGGPTLLRAAAKNFENAAPVCMPVDYTPVVSELEKNKCDLTKATRQRLALEAFRHTAHYDSAISSYLEGISPTPLDFPQVFSPSFEKVKQLRYGENPHQRGALYKIPHSDEANIAKAKQHQGKELSYNNILDADSALDLVKEFEEPAVAIIKHNNPCGVAIGKSICEAYEKALACDPDAAFGGVVAINRKLDEETAKKIVLVFTEVVIAPAFEPAALAILAQKKSLRALEVGPLAGRETRFFLRSVVGGLLVQDRDAELYSGELKTVSKRKPTASEMKAMMFAWKVCKHAKSNVCVFALADRTIGIGAGQMKRVDAIRLGAMIARSPTKGTSIASDAFFPFRDGIDAAAEAGVTAVIQPGGSIRDEEVIKAADEHGMAMVFTGMRHFKH